MQFAWQLVKRKMLNILNIVGKGLAENLEKSRQLMN